MIRVSFSLKTEIFWLRYNITLHSDPFIFNYVKVIVYKTLRNIMKKEIFIFTY